MKLDNIGKYNNIDSFVNAKLKEFNAVKPSFKNMFELMFSEKNNIFYEKSNGYKIEYCTYGEAYEMVNICANRLSKQTGEQEKEAVIGIYMDNSIDWIIAFWAILKCGYKPLLLNLRLGDDVIYEVMKTAEAVTVISDGKKFDFCNTILFDDISYEDCEKEEGGKLPAEFGSEILVMSSGTTAHPKICAYSAQEFFYQVNDSYRIISECRQIKKHYEGQLKLLTFLPFYHVFGLIAVYIWFAFFSRTFVHLNDYSADTILNTIRRHKVTHIFAVPLFWNEVYKEAVKTIKARGEDVYKKFCKGISIASKIGGVPILGNFFIRRAFAEVRGNLFGESICFLITGGSEIKEEVLSFFNLIGYHLANGYGMTEIGITSVELSDSKKMRNRGFAGKPFLSVEYKISKDGILLVRSKAMAKYILENGVKTERAEWFNTNDFAECINGHYRILGRKDDIVIAPNGENLNPAIIEEGLCKGGDYQLCLIAPKTNGNVTPIVLVFAGRHLTAERYKRIHLAVEKRIAEMELSALIGKIVFIDEPLISDNDIKINRTRLKTRYEAGELEILKPNHRIAEKYANDSYFAYIRELFAVTFNKPADEIDADSDFFLDEGGTSLEYFAFIAKIQADYNIDFPAQQDNTLTTVYELSEFLKGKQQ